MRGRGRRLRQNRRCHGESVVLIGVKMKAVYLLVGAAVPLDDKIVTLDPGFTTRQGQELADFFQPIGLFHAQFAKAGKATGTGGKQGGHG